MCLGPRRVAAAGRVSNRCASSDPNVAGRTIVARRPDRGLLRKRVFGTDYARACRAQFAEPQFLCMTVHLGRRFWPSIWGLRAAARFWGNSNLAFSVLRRFIAFQTNLSNMEARCTGTFRAFGGRSGAAWLWLRTGNWQESGWTPGASTMPC